MKPDDLDASQKDAMHVVTPYLTIRTGGGKQVNSGGKKTGLALTVEAIQGANHTPSPPRISLLT
jgi:hypothetical protein